MMSLPPNVCRAVLCAAALFAAPLPASAQPAPAAAPVALIEPEAVAKPRDLPTIGKWMIDRSGTVAHWLGQMVDGKRLYEPINVILIDAGASDENDARKRLAAAMLAAGYPVRFGHSTGYRGLIGGQLYDQMPQGRDDAFSNHLFEETNNHGRVFGPHTFNGAFVFIAAFSRERVDLLRWPGHRYASFNMARDDLATHFAITMFKSGGYVTLGNAVAANPRVTTGDHDGRALVLRAP